MNILLIEDNESISDGLKYSLETQNYKVKVCNNSSIINSPRFHNSLI